MNIVWATSESVPFAKTGGLADVAGSLPPALAEQGAETAVILPLYRRVREKFADQLTFLGKINYNDFIRRHLGAFAKSVDGGFGLGSINVRNEAVYCLSHRDNIL